MATRKIREIRYSRDLPPIRISWNPEIHMSREDAALLAEGLYKITSDRNGASFFYPNEDRSETLCRFEWHLASGRDKFKYRIGIAIKIGKKPPFAVEGYITSSKNIKSPESPFEEIPASLIEKVQRDFIETINAAISMHLPSSQQTYHFVFHIEVPYGQGFSHDFTSPSGELLFKQTKIIGDQNKRVSAVIASVTASGQDEAQTVALSKVTLACAVLTLGEGQRYDVTSLRWSKRQTPPQCFANKIDIKDEVLYPHRKKYPQAEKMDELVLQRFKWTWEAISILREENLNTFTPALFAYYGATVRHKDTATLSVIGYSAALSALAGEYKERCQGILVCGECGPLNWKHDLLGETAAITRLVAMACGISDENKKREIKKIIQGVYRDQRSAFVHGAKFSHEEYSQGSGLPSALPTKDKAVQDLFVYEEELRSISLLTRRTLLGWLEEKSSKELPLELFDINPDKILIRSRFLMFSKTLKNICTIIS